MKSRARVLAVQRRRVSFILAFTLLTRNGRYCTVMGWEEREGR